MALPARFPLLLFSIMLYGHAVGEAEAVAVAVAVRSVGGLSEISSGLSGHKSSIRASPKILWKVENYQSN